MPNKKSIIITSLIIIIILTIIINIKSTGLRSITGTLVGRSNDLDSNEVISTFIDNNPDYTKSSTLLTKEEIKDLAEKYPIIYSNLPDKDLEI